MNKPMTRQNESIWNTGWHAGIGAAMGEAFMGVTLAVSRNQSVGGVVGAVTFLGMGVMLGSSLGAMLATAPTVRDMRSRCLGAGLGGVAIALAVAFNQIARPETPASPDTRAVPVNGSLKPFVPRPISS